MVAVSRTIGSLVVESAVNTGAVVTGVQVLRLNSAMVVPQPCEWRARR